MAARGSVTPTGKQRALDYPLTPADAARSAAGAAGSIPIHIAPRASPRAPGAQASMVSVAQSCPTFTWIPPAAPSARPRIASVDPPPMELPPSPPVFSPMQAENVKSRKDESGGGVGLKKQIYSRSLASSGGIGLYSSSAPTHVDYLSKFQPNLGQLDEAGAADDDSDEEEEERGRVSAGSGYRPSARASGGQVRRDDAESPPVGLPPSTGAVGMGIKGSRVQAVSRSGNDELSLSKSPTIFSILSTSQQNPSGLALHAGGNSPGQVLGAIASGDIHRSSGKLPERAAADAAAASSARSEDDDLQFSISLTDDQEGEEEDEPAKLPPLY
jgi:hypothetical protein